MTDLRTVRRMQKARRLDENVGRRTNVRWDDERRGRLRSLSFLPDGTASEIGRRMGMSTSSVRREAQRLGIKLKGKRNG